MQWLKRETMYQSMNYVLIYKFSNTVSYLSPTAEQTINIPVVINEALLAERLNTIIDMDIYACICRYAYTHIIIVLYKKY